MNAIAHMPPDDIGQITAWYKKSHIDYAQKYIARYISYNAWYRQVTGTSNDRQAIALLKKRFVIWDDYRNHKTMRPLFRYMEQLAELTQREPLMTHVQYWSGTVEDAHDWQSLIEYWYQVRCLVVHGACIKPMHLRLAYETLGVFMDEIINRMNACLGATNYQQMDDPQKPLEQTGISGNRFSKLQLKLYQRYIASPNVWDVDMQRTGDTT